MKNKKIKQEKAITLIALIITIIILLILAVVTINAIQGDDGLITKANNAAKKYKDATSEENSLVQKYLKMIPDEDIEDDDIPEKLQKYILGADLQGRPVSEIYDFENETFINEANTIADASNSMILYDSLAKDSNTAVVYFSYNSSIYKFNVTLTLYTIASSGVTNIGKKITATSNTEPELGSTISYDGKTWTVMYINGNDIQIISDDALQYNENSLYLGSNDTYLTAKGTLLGSTYKEETIYSYNNAITTLNSVCDEIITKSSFVTDVRCVGSNPNNKNSESSSYYTSDWLTIYPTDNPGVYNGVGKDTDYNLQTDYERLILLEKTKASNDTSYWLASRCVDENSDGIFFDISYVSYDGYITGMEIWHVRKSGAHVASYNDCCLRPIVTIDTTKCTFSYDSANNYFTVSAK